MLIKQLNLSLRTLSVYQNLKHDSAFKSLTQTFNAIVNNNSILEICECYSNFCAELYKSESVGNFHDHIINLILEDVNTYSLLCTKYGANASEQMPKPLKFSALTDIKNLFLVTKITSKDIENSIKNLYPEYSELIALPQFNDKSEIYENDFDWSDGTFISNYYKENGVGQFSKYRTFYFSDEDEILPVKTPRVVLLKDLKKYEFQKNQVLDNTKRFTEEKTANNVLIYGDRGTGKSTLVHAMLSEFPMLRLVQIGKENLTKLPVLAEQIGKNPQKFIVYIDDLTFNENEKAFNTLKTLLEGSVNPLPKNMIIYATTNRRHLIKETFSGREGNEVHAGDTRDESASLSDRFGLMVTFTKPTLDQYIEMVVEIAQDRGIKMDEKELISGAKRFAVRKASFSGRIAQQYLNTIEK